MSPHRYRYRLPVSARHAFALAFDLAVRRDPLHSLAVPLLLRAPWILALGLLPPLAQTDRPFQVMAITCVALIGDFLLLLIVGAMLRLRARSVFNSPPGTRPAPVDECYLQGLRRLPWLLLTEMVRSFVLLVATLFFILPGIYLGFRLALATEAVVLTEPNTASAFARSFRLTESRFGRWLEMVVLSVLMMVAALFLVAALAVLAPGALSINGWVTVARLLITALTPVIQYAWTFFFLRLVESEMSAPGIEVGPAYAGGRSPDWSPAVPGPHPLTLVEPDRPTGNGGHPESIA